LYAYAKVAEGKDFSAAKKPGMFDLAVRLPNLASTHCHTTPIEHAPSEHATINGNKPVSNTDNTQGKAKYNKWKEVVDAGTTKKQAEDKYVELGEQLVAKHDK
jgi:acyl-CoA-binding protein